MSKIFLQEFCLLPGKLVNLLRIKKTAGFFFVSRIRNDGWARLLDYKFYHKTMQSSMLLANIKLIKLSPMHHPSPCLILWLQVELLVLCPGRIVSAHTLLAHFSESKNLLARLSIFRQTLRRTNQKNESQRFIIIFHSSCKKKEQRLPFNLGNLFNDSLHRIFFCYSQLKTLQNWTDKSFF